MATDRRTPASPLDGRCPVGRIVGTHGLRGTMKVDPLTEFEERFDPGATLWIDERPYKVCSASWHRTQLRLQLCGVDSIEAAEALRGTTLYAARNERPDLAQDEYYSEELVGILAVRPDGSEIGVVDAVLPFPAHDVLSIKGAMIPFVKEFVKEVDMVSRRLVLELIPGMEPGDAVDEVR